MELQPLLSDAVPTFTLANLPPDIVRAVIRAVGQPIDQLRLICPAWNTIVFEYLVDRRNHPPLEFVKFTSAIGPGYKTKHNAMEAAMEAVWPAEHSDHFRRFFRGLREDDDLDDPQHFSRVYSSWLPLRTIPTENWWYLILFSLMNASILKIHALCILIFPALVLLLLAYFLIFIRPKVEKNCRRLERIFSRCSSISNFNLDIDNQKLLRVIIRTLGDVPMKELVIFGKECDYKFRQNIIKLIRVHKVRKVVISVKKFKDFNLRKFLLKITETAREITILERELNEYGKIFGRTRNFWDKTTRELSDGSFELQIMDGEPFFFQQWESHLCRLKVTVQRS